ncbi:MAG: LON peptidase substrate-binding domain-containing protein [Gordonia sp. (in: high G+C Gram-positive bacteria)]
MFPLGSALLPGERLPLRIFEPRYRRLLDDCLTQQHPGFGVVLIARGHEVGGGDQRHDVGTWAQIDRHTPGPGASVLLAGTGTWRFEVVDWLPDNPYPQARIQRLPEPRATADETARLIEIGTRIRELIDETLSRRGISDRTTVPAFDADDLAAVGLFGWIARLPIGQADRQALLAAADTAARIHIVDDALDTLTARIRFDI